MGRSREIGLSYFPFDVDTFSDIKIRKLIKYQGGKAVTVYALLLCLIYKRGYYMRWDEELPFIISEQTGYEEAYIQEVIKSCLALGLFSKSLYDSEKVITSKGIQVRYAEAMNFFRRKTEICAFSLISSEEKGISSAFMPISSAEKQRKERKGEEKKETNYVGKEKPAPSSPEGPEKNPPYVNPKTGVCFKNAVSGRKEAKCAANACSRVKVTAAQEKMPQNALDGFLKKKEIPGGAVAEAVAGNRLRPFDENVRECIGSRQWQEMVKITIGMREIDWPDAFERFRANLVANGHDTDKSLQDFKQHFSNWLRIQHNEQIKKQQNGKQKEMVGDDGAGMRQGLGRAEIGQAKVVPSERGKSCL